MSNRTKRMFEFRQPVFFIRDPKLAKKLTVKDFDYFVDHRKMLDDTGDNLLGKSLMALRGKKWKEMRATLSPMFTGSKMRLMYNYVAKVGVQSAETIKTEIEDGGDGVYEFKELAKKFTVDVIASTVFGIEVNSFKEPGNEFQKIAGQMTNFTSLKMILKFFGLMTFPSVMKFLKINMFGKEVDDFFQKEVIEMMKIREEKGIVRHDMINLIMQVRKGNLKQEDKENENITEGFATVEESKVGKTQVKRVWDDEHLVAQCMLFFFAGFETIATTMAFMAHEITINPEFQLKLYEEIKDMEEKLNGKTINYEQIQGLNFMDQVVCETLRKWTVSPISDRVCNKEYQMEYDGKKFILEKDRIIVIPIFGFHMDPKYFPQPEKFDPERFNEENRKNIDPDTYLPFGIGPRNCIGSRFALMELKTIFYYLLLNFSFEVTEKTQIPLKLAKSPLGSKTEKGIWIGLKPRV